MAKGKFILIEGPDGSGTSTQMRLVGNYLGERGIKYLVTKEPTNNLIGGVIRAALTGVVEFDNYTLQLLFCADRGHHLAREINPTLAEGRWVLNDRYAPSTIVYGSLERVVNSETGKITWKRNPKMWDKLKAMNEYFRYPDISLFLDLPPEDSIARIDADVTRSEHELFEEGYILDLVGQGYRRLVREYPNAHLINVKASVKTIHKDIIEKIKTIM